MSEKRKVIIDTDIGVDDAFALRYAQLSCEVLGVTTVCGNVPVDMAAKNAKFCCAHYGIKAQVCRGATRPLVQEPGEPCFNIHGADGLGGVYDNPCSADAPDAINFLINTIQKHPGEVSILAIGPLTNIAVLMNLRPELGRSLRELVIMGGAFGHHGHYGNMSNFAEFNFWSDPQAADQVLRSDWPITIVPLDVTCEVQLTGEEVASLNDPFLRDISRVYLEFSQQEEGFYGMAVHDALTVAYLRQPEAFAGIHRPCRVITSGISIGQSVTPPGSMPADSNFQDCTCHQILTEVDAAAVREELLSALRLG